MKTGAKAFIRSFIISFIAFSVLAALILTVAFFATNSIDPTKSVTYLLIGALDENEDVFSLSVLRVDPNESSVSFLAIPDNTLLQENTVLQSLYDQKNIIPLKKALEDLLCVRISRYVFFRSDKIGKMINIVGDFEYSINYPFLSGENELVGTVLMNGEMAKNMFSYHGYDMRTASLAEIGLSFMQGVLSKYAEPNNVERLLNAVLDDGFCSSQYTNLTEEELRQYAKALTNYPSMTHRSVSLEGVYNETSARRYFVPQSIRSDKNIFEK